MGALLEWVQSAPKALRFVETHAVPLGVVVTAVVIAAVVAARRATRRALDARVRIAAVPSESFDPSDEEVIRFAGLLARTRSSVRGLASRRASAVRIRLIALDGGRVLQLLEGPGRSLSVLRLGGYSEVDLRPPDSVTGAVTTRSSGVVGATSGETGSENEDEEDEVATAEMGGGGAT